LGELISKNLFFRKELFPSPKHTYDLVILHRTLIEMSSQEARKELVEKLWKRTNKYFLFITFNFDNSDFLFVIFSK
jgi:hypothetical protein